MNNLFVLLESGEPQGFGAIGWVVYALFIGVFFYFVMIKPQKKQKLVAKMQSEIKVGDSVLTYSGFYGKVVDIVNDVMVIEFGTNKGVRIPVQKSAVASISEPDLVLTRDSE